MSAPTSPTHLPEKPQTNAITANVMCFAGIFLWAIGFPAADVLLETWGTLAMMLVRMGLSTFVLILFWIYLEGWESVKNTSWRAPMMIGSIGFGIGSLLFLLGQKYSDAVIPAIMAATMPIFGGLFEVILDGRKFRPRLVIGIALALIGGYLATGVKLSEGTFGLGALLCILAIPLYAWSTRTITREYPKLSPIAQTTTTLAGALTFMILAYCVALLMGVDDAKIGLLDGYNIGMLLIFSIAALAISQLLWIKSAGSLGIFFASLHMNAVPFYVMIVMVIFFDREWSWMQALGAAIVGVGVIYSQMRRNQ